MKKIAELLDIDTFDVEESEETTAIVLVKPEDSAQPEDNDYKFARSNYYDMIQQGQMALAGALRVATETDNPRAYEVVGGILKNLADVNRQLIQSGEDTQRIKAARKGLGTGSAPQVTNNTAVFVGSSNDLAKMLEDQDTEAVE